MASDSILKGSSGEGKACPSHVLRMASKEDVIKEDSAIRSWLVEGGVLLILASECGLRRGLNEVARVLAYLYTRAAIQWNVVDEHSSRLLEALYWSKRQYLTR
jgi:hypothetical protein